MTNRFITGGAELEAFVLSIISVDSSRPLFKGFTVAAAVVAAAAAELILAGSTENCLASASAEAVVTGAN